MSHDASMLMFSRLARVSAERQQSTGRLRFLVLTGIAATRAGLPNVAARCQELIEVAAPTHLVTRFDSFADALRDDDFLVFARQVERFCTTERAEHLLSELDEPFSLDALGGTAEAAALQILAGA